MISPTLALLITMSGADPFAGRTKTDLWRAGLRCESRLVDARTTILEERGLFKDMMGLVRTATVVCATPSPHQPLDPTTAPGWSNLEVAAIAGGVGLVSLIVGLIAGYSSGSGGITVVQ